MTIDIDYLQKMIDDFDRAFPDEADSPSAREPWAIASEIIAKRRDVVVRVTAACPDGRIIVVDGKRLCAIDMGNGDAGGPDVACIFVPTEALKVRVMEALRG